MRPRGMRRRRCTSHRRSAQAIVALETGLFTAQARDDACRLAARRRRDRRPGRAVATAVLHRHQRSGRSESDRRAFDPNAFTLFNAWAHADDDIQPRPGAPSLAASRSSTRNRS